MVIVTVLCNLMSLYACCTWAGEHVSVCINTPPCCTLSVGEVWCEVKCDWSDGCLERPIWATQWEMWVYRPWTRGHNQLYIDLYELYRWMMRCSPVDFAWSFFWMQWQQNLFKHLLVGNVECGNQVLQYLCSPSEGECPLFTCYLALVREEARYSHATQS